MQRRVGVGCNENGARDDRRGWGCVQAIPITGSRPRPGGSFSRGALFQRPSPRNGPKRGRKDVGLPRFVPWAALPYTLGPGSTVTLSVSSVAPPSLSATRTFTGNVPGWAKVNVCRGSRPVRSYWPSAVKSNEYVYPAAWSFTPGSVTKRTMTAVGAPASAGPSTATRAVGATLFTVTRARYSE